MQEKYKVLGEVLKNKRSELNLSLKDVEVSTSIRSNYLQAIEEGNTDKLISPIYAQGFIRQYVAFLGLDAEEIMAGYSPLFKEVNGAHIQVKNEEMMKNLGGLEVRGNMARNISWTPNIVWISLAVGIGLAAWFLAKSLDLL